MTKYHSKHFGPVLKRLREEKGLSQDAVSERVGVSTAFICMLESSTKFPNLEMLFRLAEALDMKASALISSMESRLGTQPLTPDKR